MKFTYIYLLLSLLLISCNNQKLQQETNQRTQGSKSEKVVQALSESIARGLERVGTVDDFMPTGESFVADLVELEVVIGEDRHKIKAAVAPGLLTMLRATQIDGIIGLDVLQHVSYTFSYANRCMAPVLRFA